MLINISQCHLAETNSDLVLPIRIILGREKDEYTNKRQIKKNVHRHFKAVKSSGKSKPTIKFGDIGQNIVTSRVDQEQAYDENDEENQQD